MTTWPLTFVITIAGAIIGSWLTIVSESRRAHSLKRRLVTNAYAELMTTRAMRFNFSSAESFVSCAPLVLIHVPRLLQFSDLALGKEGEVLSLLTVVARELTTYNCLVAV